MLSQAQYYLAIMWNNGQGGAVDHKEARRLYTLAAERVSAPPPVCRERLPFLHVLQRLPSPSLRLQLRLRHCVTAV